MKLNAPKQKEAKKKTRKAFHFFIHSFTYSFIQFFNNYLTVILDPELGAENITAERQT